MIALIILLGVARAENTTLEDMNTTETTLMPFITTTDGSSSQGHNYTIEQNGTTIDKCINGTNCTLGNVTTTMAPITTTKVPVVEKKMIDFGKYAGKHCFCDKQENFCDINCCCDKDCSEDNKKVFEYCKEEHFTYEPDFTFCEEVYGKHKNESLYTWEALKDSLFCVMKSNTPMNRKSETKITKCYNLQNSKHHLAEVQKDSFGWKIPTEQRNDLQTTMPNKSFTFGDDLWIIKNDGNVSIFELPTSFYTSTCLITNEIKYLQNQKTECSQPNIDPQNKFLNLHNYVTNISFVASPDKYFHCLERKNNCTTNYSIPIELQTCDESLKNCTRANNTIKPLYIRRQNEFVGLNLVTKLLYCVYHNGTRGIDKVKLYAYLSNATFPAGSDYQHKQYFNVNYFWSNYTYNVTDYYSNRNGYEFGQMILFGRLMRFNITVNVTKPKEESKNVTINYVKLLNNDNGYRYCSLEGNLYYNKDLIKHCLVKDEFKVNISNNASFICKEIQRKIFDNLKISNLTRIFTGYGNLTENLLDIWLKINYVPNTNATLNDVKGIYMSEKSKIMCNNLLLGVKYGIFGNNGGINAIYGAFGHNVTTQMKIDKQRIVFSAKLTVAIKFDSECQSYSSNNLQNMSSIVYVIVCLYISIQC